MARTELRGFEWAGCTIAIETVPGWDWRWPQGWEDRVGSATAADVHVSLAVTDSPAMIPDGLPYTHEGAFFEAGHTGGDPLFSLSDGRLARFDRGFEWGAVTVPASVARTGGFPMARPLDDLVLIHRCLAGGALALRATASVRDGSALVMLGDTPIEDASPRSSTWSGWLMVEPDGYDVKVSPLPSTLVAGGPSPASAHLAGIHLVETTATEGECATTLDPEAGAAEILRFAFAPLVSAIRSEKTIEIASRLAERVTLVRLVSPGGSRFGWQRARSPVSLAPPAGA